MTNSNVIQSLAPLFAAGLAIQQLIELLDGIFQFELEERQKKTILKAIAFAVGWVFAHFGRMTVLAVLNVPNVNMYVDEIVTALIISGGTEGLNSIIKFLGYAKEEKKVDTRLKKIATTDADGSSRSQG